MLNNNVSARIIYQSILQLINFTSMRKKNHDLKFDALCIFKKILLLSFIWKISVDFRNKFQPTK